MSGRVERITRIQQGPDNSRGTFIFQDFNVSASGAKIDAGIGGGANRLLRPRGFFIQQDGQPPASGGERNIIPLPTTMEEAWEIFSSTYVRLTDIPKTEYLFPLDQNMVEELGTTSLQMADIRTNLANQHGIEIPAAEEGEWPETVKDYFEKYLAYTPVGAVRVSVEGAPDNPVWTTQPIEVA